MHEKVPLKLGQKGLASQAYGSSLFRRRLYAQRVLWWGWLANVASTTASYACGARTRAGFIPTGY